MKNPVLVLAAAFVPLICALPAVSETFVLDEGTARAEMEVKKGDRFTLTLRGKRWYLREYDSSVLGFVSRGREVETEGSDAGQGGTDFVFYPYRSGTGHLTFIGRGTEMYVLVHVDGEGRLEETAGGAQTDRANEAVFENEAGAPLAPLMTALEPAAEPVPPSAPKAEPRVEEPAVPLAEPVPVPDTMPAVPQPSPPPGPGEPAKSKGSKEKQYDAVKSKSESTADEPKSGMFYTDKQDRVVGVQYKNEEEAYKRGLQLYKKAQADKALAEFLKYLAECEKCVHREEANYIVAELYVKQGRDGEAVAHLDTLLLANSPDVRLKALLLRADIDLRGGNTKRAVDEYSTAWNMDTRNKELPRKIADLYYQTKDFESALSFYERSIENASADDEVYFRAASICDGEGKARNLEKAYTYYKTLIERFKNSGHVEYARRRVEFLEKNFYNFK